MDLFYVFFSVLCLLCLRVRLFICALWSPAGKGLTYWLPFVVSYCEFFTFPLVSWVQVWYLIVSIPDLCTLTYFYKLCKNANLKNGGTTIQMGILHVLLNILPITLLSKVHDTSDYFEM